MKVSSSDGVAKLYKHHDLQQSTARSNPKVGNDDTVTFTYTANRLRYIEKAVHASDNNSGRLENIRTVVNEGKLKINPFHIAQKLVSFEYALNRARTAPPT